MGRKRDRFWEYAKELDGRFKCNFCGEDFPGGISRIKSHLSRVKGRDIDICRKVPDDVLAKAHQAIGSLSNKKGKNIKHSDDNECLIVDDNNPTSSTTTLTCSQSKKKASVDEKFLKFQIENGFFKNYPQTLVEFVKAVSEYGPSYELPNWYTHRTEAPTAYKDEILRCEEGVKKSWSETGCTLMIVAGVDYNKGEVKVFAYCPKGTLFLTSGPYRKICDNFNGIIEGIGTHHIVQVIQSGAIFTGDIFNLIKESQPRVLSMLCPTDQLSFMFDHIADCERSNHLLAVRMIFIYMRKHSMEFARKIFDKYKEYKRIVYADDISLLLSMVELESQVIRVVQSLDTKSSDLGKWAADVIVDTKFWTLGKQLVHIIDILIQVVHVCRSSKAPGFGYLYEAVKKACNAIYECCPDDPLRYCRVKYLCREQLQRMITPLHAAASFLNPAIFMSRENFREDSLIKEGMSCIVNDFIADES